VAADIATQSAALSFLGVVDAPLTGSMRASIDRLGALGPLSASLELGAGAVRPNVQTTPIRFNGVKTYLTYDPNDAALRFDQIEVNSDLGAVNAEGHAYLRDFRNGFPEALLGQFEFSDLTINPEGVYENPVSFEQAFADVRLKLRPFELTIGQIALVGADTTLHSSGRIGTSAQGWTVALDSRIADITRDRVMALWPLDFKAKIRQWVSDNLQTGDLSNVASALRMIQGEIPVITAGFEFTNTQASVVRGLPPVRQASGNASLVRDNFTVVLDDGFFQPPQGGRVQVGGSVFQISNVAQPAPPALITINADSTITAALSLLDQPPFRFLTKANRPVTLADGRAQTRGTLTLPLRKRIELEDIAFDISSTLRAVQTDQIIPDRTLSADRLAVSVTPERLRVEGNLRVGRVPAQGTWTLPFDTSGSSRVEASVELSETFVDEFNIGLPNGATSGSAPAAITIDLLRGQPPSFALVSQMRGLGLRLDAMGWRKPASARGRLEVGGTLGTVPRIDRLAIEGSGLEAVGSVRFNSNGSFDRAQFSPVRLGGWLNALVELRGRGAGRPVQVVLNGGTLDLRRAEFGGGNGSEGGPMSVALDRLQITEGIALENFRAELSGANGLSGSFTGDVNGGQSVQGTLVPQNGGSAVRIQSDNAGGVLRAAGFLPGARRGIMDLVLVPTGAEGSYDGQLGITDIRLRDAPTMAALLDAISIVGLLQQLDGNGLLFTEVDVQFRITPNQIIISESSAIGPSIGVSLDGFFTLANARMDFQGVASPLYLINGIGSALTRRGEGLIGFAFNLRGTPDDPDVQVNPLSVLTPGMFREIFRRPAPQITQ
jgi:hypothetical protein